MPDIDNGLDHVPARFDHVCALKESGIAGHAIAQEAFVTSTVFGAEVGAVIKIHVYQAELHDCAGHFCAEAERDTFIGLDVNDQPIGFEIFHGGVAEEYEWRATELNDDFCGALPQPLAGAEIKRDAGPAPVVDLQLHGDEGFRVGLGRNVRLAAIADDGYTVDDAWPVLSAHHAGEHIFRAEGLNSVQDFGLFV